MKKNKTNEENMFQKYDDLFAEQDEKYDTNNTNRYAKKKNVRSEDVEYQRYVPKKTTSNDTNKNMLVIGLFMLFVFGIVVFGFTNFAFTANFTPIIIIIGFALLSSFFRKNKRK